MQNLTVHLGSATPLSSRAGPLAPVLSTAPADKPTPPVSGTTARHCVTTHPSDASLPTLSGRHERARRTLPASAVLGPLPGDARRSGPGPMAPLAPRGTPMPGTPTFSPSLFFPSAALPSSSSLPAHAAPLVPPSPLLFDPSSRAPELPHRSPHPDRHLRPPAAPSSSRILTEHRRRPPLHGELLPELPIPKICCKSLTPSPLLSCRASSPLPATTGAPSPPTNAATRRRLHRLTVDPPFRYAPALSSLPDTFPVTPSRSPATPCRRRATAEPSASTPPCRPARGLRVVTAPARAARALQQAAQAGCPAGLGCQAMAMPTFRPTARGRPSCPVGSSLGPVSTRYCAGDFKCFSNCFKSQKLVQNSKIRRNL
jgi:hypothetical protein